MSNNPLVKIILEKHNLIDYLSQQGHKPIAQNARYFRYLCPLHKETNGSFFVYFGSRLNYYCYGCSQSGDIINLVSQLENITIKQAFGKLLHGLDIDHDDILIEAAAKMREESIRYQKTLEDYAFLYSLSFRKYLESVKHDPTEVQFLESVYAKIDVLIQSVDLEVLEDLYSKLIEKMYMRQTIYTKAQEQRDIERHGTRISS